MDDITITTTNFSVTLKTTSIIDKMSNKLFLITPGTSLSNYNSGPKSTKIVNLLRITKQININQGSISAIGAKTAKQVKEDLKSIFDGGLKGELATLTYDGDASQGFIEDLQIVELARDLAVNGATVPDDAARYSFQLNFVIGTLTSG